LRDQAITVIALNLDDALLHRAARSAELLQSRSKLLEFGCAERQAVDDRYSLAGATRDLTTDANGSRSAARARGLRYHARPRGIGFHHDAPVRVLGLQAGTPFSSGRAGSIIRKRLHS